MLIHVSYHNGDNEYYETGYFRIYESDGCYETSGNEHKEQIGNDVKTIHLNGELVYECKDY